MRELLKYGLWAVFPWLGELSLCCTAAKAVRVRELLKYGLWAVFPPPGKAFSLSALRARGPFFYAAIFLRGNFSHRKMFKKALHLNRPFSRPFV